MSSACDILTDSASEGVAAALRAVDCLAGETVASGFARLFGSNGALLPALTIGLTLYIAFFAISLLTGRSSLGISALTPRALTLGLVLTFATSWVAYSEVVWTLATGAPDQIAGVITGAQGSATQIFGDRVDLVFAAIAEAAEAGKQAAVPAAATAQAGAQAAGQAAQAAVSGGNFTAANLMWLGALLLLLGTVGVLVTARIALAVLLAVGPVFVVLALFAGTRGLFVGWLRGLVLTALTPLLVVVGGGVVLELLLPVVVTLRGVEGVNGRSALALFVIACVHVALMGLTLRVAGTMVSAWQVFGLAAAKRTSGDPAPLAAAYAAPMQVQPLAPANTAALLPGAGRSLGRSGAAEVLVQTTGERGASSAGGSGTRTQVTTITQGVQSSLPPLAKTRARGIGSRFAAPQARVQGMMR